MEKALSCNKCNMKFDTCTCEKVSKAPIIHKTDEKTVIVTHNEPVEIKKDFEKV